MNRTVFSEQRISRKQLQTVIQGLKKQYLKAPGHTEGTELLFHSKLYYLPYYLFHLKGHQKRRVLWDLHKEAVISVDGIGGYFAKTVPLTAEDRLFPEPFREEGTEIEILTPSLSVNEAFEIGKEALRKSNSMSFSHAFWLKADLEMEYSGSVLIYKPFWSISVSGTPQETAPFIVDAMSGETGGNNGYRALCAIKHNSNRKYI